MIHRLHLLFLLGLLSSRPASAGTFSVVVYNVENLFDADCIALYADHRPPVYTREHLLRKLTNISAVLARYNSGRGPDIILFQEIESDQSPAQNPAVFHALLQRHADDSVETLIREKWSPELADLPAEVWLHKTLVDSGFFEYEIAIGDDPTLPTEFRSVVKNVTFSRFPIRETRLHPLDRARPILETVLEIDGHPFHVFNNHWKSGASNPETEPIRRQNARVLRDRISQILAADPRADILIGGDLNSHYNQNIRLPEVSPTAINDILHSQGDELAIRRKNGPALYNLWHELPPEKRGVDIFRGEWGTLLHLIVSRGLYDHRGIQYIDNSFGVSRFPGLNADPATGLPLRWTAVENGGGFSDHFPLVAHFRIAESRTSDRWLNLKNPSRSDSAKHPPANPIDYAAADFSQALDAEKISRENPLQKSPHLIGRTFLVRARVTGEFPFRITVGAHEEIFGIWNPDEEFRVQIYETHPLGSEIQFHAQLINHHGSWQFLIPHSSWLLPPQKVKTSRH